MKHNKTTAPMLSREDRERFVSLGLDAAIQRAEAEVQRLKHLKQTLSQAPSTALPLKDKKKHIVDRAAKMWAARNKKQRKPKGQGTTADAMFEVLKASGPLSPNDLTERMKASGWYTSSKHPREVVYQMARVDSRFVITTTGTGNRRSATISLTAPQGEPQNAEQAENVEGL